MKVRNLVLGMMLAANVLTAQGAVFTTAATTAAIVASNTTMLASANNARSSEKTIDAVSSTILNSQNTTILGCTLEYERVTKDGEWIGTIVPSLEKTVNDSECQSNKKTIEQLNNTHYEFGKVKGIFSVGANEHIMIELVEVNE
mgnify:CR=1 FL=1